MTPRWLDEIEPIAEPPFVRMGTRALGEAGEWLLGGDDVADQLAEKQRLLVTHHDDVVATLPGTEAPAAELLDLIGRPVPGLHPIDAAGRQVAEDLCLLLQDDRGRWVLTAGSVCFPSHWRLPDKLGLPLAAVHDPVPDYATDLADRVDRFLDKLRVGRGVWRRNWTIHTTPDLYAPEVPPVDPGLDPAACWLRSERQTLTRLPLSGAVVFTIRTQQTQLATLPAALLDRLASAVAAWPNHQVAYRGGEALRRPLLRWLTTRNG